MKMDGNEMIKIYRTAGLAYRLATRTMKKAVELAFEGELIARNRKGEDILDPATRTAAAVDALRGIKLPVLKEDEHRAKALVDEEVARLATHKGRF